MSDFSLGAGYGTAKLVRKEDGSFSVGYAIGWAFNALFGYGASGLGYAVDLTGVAAGFIPIVSRGGRITHNNVNILVTHNGTDTKVYRQESGACALKETVTSKLATDVLSFHDDTNSTL